MIATPRSEIDAYWMRQAIAMARIGQREGEWPFGAVVVRPDDANPTRQGVPLSEAHSTERCTNNPAGHAELHAIEQAGLRYGRLLRGCTLYTTHEPCVMCSGLILQAKPSRVVVGTLRADRPDLFSSRRDRFASLIERNMSRAWPIACSSIGQPLRDECLALFDGLEPEHAAVA